MHKKKPKALAVQKYCPACQQTYQDPYEYFWKHPRMIDGLQTLCKKCQNTRTKRYKYTYNKPSKHPWGLQGQALEDLVQQQIQNLHAIRRNYGL